MIAFYLPHEVYDFFQVKGADGWMHFQCEIKPDIQEHITQFGGETQSVYKDQNAHAHLIVNRQPSEDGSVLDTSPIVMFADESNAVAFKLMVATHNIQLEIVKFDQNGDHQG